MKEHSDIDLLTALMQDDEVAFTTLYTRYQPSLFEVCMKWTYEQDFDGLFAYPNHFKADLAKGTFVQGHYPLGWYATTEPTALYNVKAPAENVKKTYRDGQILIIKNKKVYNVLGIQQ